MSNELPEHIVEVRDEESLKKFNEICIKIDKYASTLFEEKNFNPMQCQHLCAFSNVIVLNIIWLHKTFGFPVHTLVDFSIRALIGGINKTLGDDEFILTRKNIHPSDTTGAMH